MARKKNLLVFLRKWLKSPENTKTKLAKKLGYSSTSTISNWFSRSRVPEFQRERIEREFSI